MAAEGAYRASRSTGVTTGVTTSTQLLRQQRSVLEAEYQDKLTLMKPEHPEMVSLRSRIDELDRQIARESSTVKAGESVVADIELMFSHIDQNMAGLRFPEHNFVFTEQFTELLKTYRLDSTVTL